MRIFVPYEEKPPTSLPELVRAVRRRVGTLQQSGRINQEDFAKKLKINRQTITWWETGRNAPSGSAVVLLEILYKHPALFNELDDFDLGLISKEEQ